MNGSEWAHEGKVRDFLKKKREEQRERRSAATAQKQAACMAEHGDEVRAAEAHLTNIGFTVVGIVKRFEYESL